MKLSNIITHRYIDHWPSWDLVYEWEDVFANALNLRLCDVCLPKNKYLKKICHKFPRFQFFFFPFSYSLYFDLVVDDSRKYNNGLNNRMVIRWLVDCYTRTPEEIENFKYNYSKNKYIFISNREVYDFLKLRCDLPLYHLPLSLPDKYAITPITRFKKDYDVILMGRQNPILLSYLKEYEKRHCGFSCLYRKIEDDNFNYYNKEGIYIGNANTRDNYMSLICRTRVGLYSTPGTDNEKPVSHGYSQVTPRLLEYISAGVHIIARYIKNVDTDYFELEKFCKSINTYEEFEERMDWCLTHEVNMQEYASYLSKHYTSVRISELNRILDRDK